MKTLSLYVLGVVLVLLTLSDVSYARGGGGHHYSHRSYSSRSSSSPVHVRGYYRKNGTYVQPHYRTRPNYTKSDNWSTKGNVNPYTGKAGTVDP